MNLKKILACIAAGSMTVGLLTWSAFAAGDGQTTDPSDSDSSTEEPTEPSETEEPEEPEEPEETLSWSFSVNGNNSGTFTETGTQTLSPSVSSGPISVTVSGVDTSKYSISITVTGTYSYDEEVSDPVPGTPCACGEYKEATSCECEESQHDDSCSDCNDDACENDSSCDCNQEESGCEGNGTEDCSCGKSCAASEGDPDNTRTENHTGVSFTKTGSGASFTVSDSDLEGTNATITGLTSVSVTVSEGSSGGDDSGSTGDTTTAGGSSSPSGPTGSGASTTTTTTTTAAAEEPDVAETPSKSEAVTAEDKESGVVLEAAAGVFDEPVELVVKPSTETVSVGKNTVTVAAFDITLENAAGVKVQPNGYVTVTIEVPANLLAENASKYYVYYMADDGTLTDMHATFDGKNVTFSTNHFSTYIISPVALVEEEGSNNTTNPPADGGKPDAPVDGGSNGSSDDDAVPATGVFVALIPVITAAAGVVISKKTK